MKWSTYDNILLLSRAKKISLRNPEPGQRGKWSSRIFASQFCKPKPFSNVVLYWQDQLHLIQFSPLKAKNTPYLLVHSQGRHIEHRPHRPAHPPLQKKQMPKPYLSRLCCISCCMFDIHTARGTGVFRFISSSLHAHVLHFLLGTLTEALYVLPRSQISHKVSIQKKRKIGPTEEMHLPATWRTLTVPKELFFPTLLSSMALFSHLAGLYRQPWEECGLSFSLRKIIIITCTKKKKRGPLQDLRNTSSGFKPIPHSQVRAKTCYLRNHWQFQLGFFYLMEI